jgi:hypothetical protein
MRKPKARMSATVKVPRGVCTQLKGVGPSRRMPLRAMAYCVPDGVDANEPMAIGVVVKRGNANVLL